MFFTYFQACQGAKCDPGASLVADAIKPETDREIRIPEESDILIFHSTVPGKHM